MSKKTIPYLAIIVLGLVSCKSGVAPSLAKASKSAPIAHGQFFTGEVMILPGERDRQIDRTLYLENAGRKAPGGSFDGLCHKALISIYGTRRNAAPTSPTGRYHYIRQ
jgi:hypothetical protein